jgi:uncharacterized protein YicC (UPF0701 family)
LHLWRRTSVLRCGAELKFCSTCELEDRVKELEESVKSLGQVPGQIVELRDRVTNVESQIVQLRREMGDGFTAVLEVIQSSSDATQKLLDNTRLEARTLFGGLKDDLTNEIRATRTQMRALHEDLVERIKTLGKH